MENLWDILLPVIALVITFVIGLIQNKPGYTKGKNVIATIDKALEDDKLTTEELKAIYDAVKSQVEPPAPQG